MPSDYSPVLCNSLGNIIFVLQSNVWLGHNTNSSIGSVVVKRLNL